MIKKTKRGLCVCRPDISGLRCPWDVSLQKVWRIYLRCRQKRIQQIPSPWIRKLRMRTRRRNAWGRAWWSRAGSAESRAGDGDTRTKGMTSRRPCRPQRGRSGRRTGDAAYWGMIPPPPSSWLLLVWWWWSGRECSAEWAAQHVSRGSFTALKDPTLLYKEEEDENGYHFKVFPEIQSPRSMPSQTFYPAEIQCARERES